MRVYNIKAILSLLRKPDTRESEYQVRQWLSESKFISTTSNKEYKGHEVDAFVSNYHITRAKYDMNDVLSSTEVIHLLQLDNNPRIKGERCYTEILASMKIVQRSGYGGVEGITFSQVLDIYNTYYCYSQEAYIFEDDLIEVVGGKLGDLRKRFKRMGLSPTSFSVKDWRVYYTEDDVITLTEKYNLTPYSRLSRIGLCRRLRITMKLLDAVETPKYCYATHNKKTGVYYYTRSNIGDVKVALDEYERRKNTSETLDKSEDMLYNSKSVINTEISEEEGDYTIPSPPPEPPEVSNIAESEFKPKVCDVDINNIRVTREGDGILLITGDVKRLYAILDLIKEGNL